MEIIGDQIPKRNAEGSASIIEHPTKRKSMSTSWPLEQAIRLWQTRQKWMQACPLVVYSWRDAENRVKILDKSCSACPKKRLCEMTKKERHHWLKHICGCYHIAHQYGVQPLVLGRAIHGLMILDGTWRPRQRKARGWQRRLTPQQAIAQAELLLTRWMRRKQQTEKHIVRWRKRLKAAHERLEIKSI